MNSAPPRPDGLRIGVVGVGHLGAYHLAKYLDHPAVASVVIHDSEPRKAEGAVAGIEASLPLTVAETLEECLAASDAVSVAVPTTRHLDIAGRALDAGCHVLVEKPIAGDSGEAEQLVTAAARSGAILQVGHVERFNPAFQGLDVGSLTPGFIETHRLAPYNPRGTDVDVVFDLMVHDLDLILYLVGEKPVSVEAVGVPVITGRADIANARVTFEGGCVANITASRVSLAPMRKLRVFQPSNYLSFDLQKGTRELVRLCDAGEQVEGEEVTVMQIGERTVTRSEQGGEQDALALEIDAFLRAVSAAERGERVLPPHGVSGVEATEALDLAERITRQIDTD
ncbi:Gfo/Idh/MocA family oxidoreductase [Gemmatimonadota bacterium]